MMYFVSSEVWTMIIWVRTCFDTLYSIKCQLLVVTHDETPLDHFFHLNSLLIAISTKFTIKINIDDIC